MKLSEVEIQKLREGTVSSLLVATVDGQEWDVWVNRRGDVNLTKARKRPTINIPVATVGGAGA